MLTSTQSRAGRYIDSCLQRTYYTYPVCIRNAFCDKAKIRPSHRLMQPTKLLHVYSLHTQCPPLHGLELAVTQTCATHESTISIRFAYAMLSATRPRSGRHADSCHSRIYSKYPVCIRNALRDIA